MSRFKRLVAVLGTAALASAALAACDSSSGSSGETGSGGLPKTINVAFVGELTGPVGFAGQAQEQALKWAIDKANASGELKGSKIVLDVKDTGSDPKRAASLMSSAAESDAVAVFGPLSSSGAMAAAPFAQRAKLPYIATSSVLPALLDVGDYIYRTQPSEIYVVNLIGGEAAKRGIKSVSMVYLSDNPTIVEEATEYLPEKFEKVGIDVLDSVDVPTATTDFGAVTSKLMRGNPDAIGVMTIGPATATIITGLRTAGYEGQIFVHASATADILKGAGDAANGAFTAVGFDQSAPNPAVQQFVQEYKADNPDVTTVNGWHAAGADAASFLVEAVVAGNGASREDIHSGMQKVAEAGFDGVYGPIQFIDGRDATAPGMVVEYDGGAMKVIAQGDPNKPIQP
ncbi:ABC transporter substrate-binding protein [Micromonospora inositola]|uniref:ABC transporter substrate-binding protein n=1 Tax=Micromonospora inositola TaxID=47865 RepID=UPI0012FD933F|nr:ABC transporter substrate-binding protein [Micromonospora inositola]